MATSSADSEIIIEPDPPTGGYGADGELLGAGSRSDQILKACFPQHPKTDGEKSTDQTQIDLYLATVKSTNTITDQFPEGVSMKYSDAPAIGSNWDDDLGMGKDDEGIERGGGPGVAKTTLGRTWLIPNLNSSPGPVIAGNRMVGASPVYQTEIYKKNTPGYFNNINYGSGPTEPLEPSETSVKISSDGFYDLAIGKREYVIPEAEVESTDE